MSSLINLCIIEDEQIIRRSLKDFFSNVEGYLFSGAFESVEDFLATASQIDKIDIILLDINLPGMTGLEGIIPIKKILPDVEIIILTTFDEPDYIFEALKKGAISYILKSSPIWEIKKCIEVVHDGGAYMTPNIARRVIRSFRTHPIVSEIDNLTPRQQEVLNAIVEGLSYKMIADKLNISEYTANDHIKAIYKKLQVNSKAEAIAKVMRHSR